MTRQRVLGIDPGPTPGLVYLEYAGSPCGAVLDRVEVVQCSAGILSSLVHELVTMSGEPITVAVETFVARGRLTAEQSLTRDQVTSVKNQVWRLGETYALREISMRERPAVVVKAWATDVRINAAGLAHHTKGMRHARDASRHALFAAVRDLGITDPLSRKAVRV